MRLNKLKISVLVSLAIFILIFANIIFFGLLQEKNQNLNVPVNDNKSLYKSGDNPTLQNASQGSQISSANTQSSPMVAHPMMNTRAS